MTNIGATAAIEAASKGINGMDASKVQGFSTIEIGRQTQKMCAAGRLHRAKLSHRVVRYFDTAERAATYLKKHSAYSIKPKTPGRNASAFAADAVAIEPENVKRTVREGYPPHRYWVDPASVPVFRYGSGGA